MLARGCRHLARRFVAPCRFTIGSSQCQCQHADFSRYARFSSRDRPKVFGKFVAGSRVRRKGFGKRPDLLSIATFDLLPICRCICNGNYVNAMVLASFSSPLFNRRDIEETVKTINPVRVNNFPPTKLVFHLFDSRLHRAAATFVSSWI